MPCAFQKESVSSSVLLFFSCSTITLGLKILLKTKGGEGKMQWLETESAQPTKTLCRSSPLTAVKPLFFGFNEKKTSRFFSKTMKKEDFFSKLIHTEKAGVSQLVMAAPLLSASRAGSKLITSSRPPKVFGSTQFYSEKRMHAWSAPRSKLMASSRRAPLLNRSSSRWKCWMGNAI